MMALKNKNPEADENPEFNTEEFPSTESVEEKCSTESDTEDYLLDFVPEEASLLSPTVDAQLDSHLFPAYDHDGRSRLFTDDSMNPEHKRRLGLKDIVKDHVLPLLPAKSLCRFKSVCKEWNQHINSSFFGHQHSYSFRKLSGFFCQYKQSYSHAFISMDFDVYGIPYHAFQFLPEEATVVRTSSNGLVCCQGYSGDKGYYICNPVTGQWHALPRPALYHGPETAIALAFEPDVYNFSENYELICAIPMIDQPVLCFEIFSSRSRTWRIAETVCSDLNGFFWRDGFFNNGFAYWETTAGEVLVFDLSYEQYSVLSLPATHGEHGVLTESNGELCYVLPSKQENDECLIEVYGGMGMQLKYSISFPFENNPSYHLRALPSLSDDIFVVLVGTKLAIYYAKEKEALFMDLEGINMFGKFVPEGINRFGKFVPYVNSLVPVRHHILFSEIQLSNLSLNTKRSGSSSSSSNAGRAKAY